MPWWAQQLAFTPFACALFQQWTVCVCVGAAEGKRSPLTPHSEAAAASAANSRSAVRRPAPKRRRSLDTENIPPPPVPLFVGSATPPLPKRALPTCPPSSSRGTTAFIRDVWCETYGVLS